MSRVIDNRRRNLPRCNPWTLWHRLGGLAVTLTLFSVIPATAVALEIELVTVGNPGNRPDQDYGRCAGTDLTEGCGPFGAVDYVYRIGKFEVTNSQYTEFLNAVDPFASNRLSLYSEYMESDARGGITFDDTRPQGSKFAVKEGRGRNPVVFVSWYSALRFANWLNNGQGNGDTENGSYTLLGGTPKPSNGDTVTRNDGARWFVPSEDEWYKAAYHQPASQGGDIDDYWFYPTSSNEIPFSDQPPGTDAPDISNTANFWKYDGLANGYDDGYAISGINQELNSFNHLSDVGAYVHTVNFYGTFDQGGNALEWTEADVFSDGGDRGTRGGSFLRYHLSMAADTPDIALPEFDVFFNLGFRIAARSQTVGDLDLDAQLTAQDVDLLSNALRTESTDLFFDLNGDAQVDASDREYWVKTSRNTWFGDSNLDGEFNSSDLVLVFRAGQYGDALALNSTWRTGDWDGDGDFTSSDLVRAFEDGGFEKGPRQMVAPVPEPSSVVLFAFATLWGFAIQRARRGSGQ